MKIYLLIAALFFTFFSSTLAVSSTVGERIYLTNVNVTTWTVPADWNSSNNSIEVIGGGASGIYGCGNQGGGGSGAQGVILITYTSTVGNVINNATLNNAQVS